MFHTSFKKGLLFDDEAFNQFEGAWRDAMGHEGLYSKGTRVITTLEQIRRLNVTILKEKKRNAMDTYKNQFMEIEEAKASLELDWSDLLV